MRDLIAVAETADAVRLSYLKAVLEADGVAFFILGADVLGLWPGALPARIMVRPRDARRAREALAASDPSLIWT